MKIGIDGRLWHESGVGRYIRNLINELSKIDKDNQYVLFLRDKNEVRPCNLPSNWRLVKANIHWHTVGEQIKFLSILNQECLDLMHFPYFSVPIFYNRPFVVTIHDLILNHFPTGEASTLPLPLYKAKLIGYKFIISQAAKKARKIIVPSNATESEIVDHLGVSPDKVVVTYEGIDQQIASSISHIENNHKLRAISHKQFFLYVGNAYPHKNLERLFMAFKGIRNRESGIKLVLVGKEDYFYKRLKEKVRQIGLSGSVIFFGDANDWELVGLYQNAKALVMPSLMEGFGLPALEAMVNKCLVLASDIPALREICEDAAIYFDPYNIDDLYQKMKEVNSNDMYYYSGYIKRGVERAKEFSWKKMAKETLKIYEGCIGL